MIALPGNDLRRDSPTPIELQSRRIRASSRFARNVNKDCASWPDRRGAALAGADAHTIVHRQDENLAVADLARLRRAGGMDDGLDRRFDEGVVDGDLHLQLR